MMWAELRVPVGKGACGDVCIMIGIIDVKVAIGPEMAVSASSGLRGSSDSLTAGGVCNAMNGDCFHGMLCWEMEAEVIGAACCNYSMTPMSCSLPAVVMLPGSLVVSVGGGGRTSIECRVWGMAVTSSGCMLLRSTAISCSLLAHCWGGGIPEGNYLKVNCKASIWPLKPSGHTMRYLHCSSLCT